jgi:integrase
MTTRQYARLVSEWITGIGLDANVFGTHSLRRTKPTLIYRRTGNLRAVQLLLGHTKIESTVRYLGIEVDARLPSLKKLTSGLAHSRNPIALPICCLGFDPDVFRLVTA